MKLIYISPLQFPASSGMHVYIRELAKRFSESLKENFLLLVRDSATSDLIGVNYQSVNFPFMNLRTVFYFFWLPLFIARNRFNSGETVFFANDPNLLVVLAVWKFFFGYRLASDWHQFVKDWRDSFVAGRSDYLITTSLKLKKSIIDSFCVNETKILAAHGGVNLSENRPDKNTARKILNLSPEKRYVGYMGFFMAAGFEKGIKTMIEALPCLDSQINLLLVGGKVEEIAEYGKLAEKLGVKDRCVFSGRKKQEEIAVYESACDILAIPYPDQPHFRDYGFPMKVYEYIASGRPIIYSKLEMAEEIIGGCATSFIPDNAVDFARAVKEIFSFYPKKEEEAKKAFEKLGMYTWEKKAEKIIDFINK